jgi:hypothetical protein
MKRYPLFEKYLKLVVSKPQAFQKSLFIKLTGAFQHLLCKYRINYQHAPPDNAPDLAQKKTQMTDKDSSQKQIFTRNKPFDCMPYLADSHSNSTLFDCLENQKMKLSINESEGKCCSDLGGLHA